ncbi:MAG: carbohydrate kinase family protein [Anaerolineales bacterium]
MPDRKYDLVVAGEINPDLILTDPQLEPRFGQAEILVKDAALTPGSSSVIFACGAARLGLKVAFIGVAGNDVFGHFMLEALKARGVDISNVIVDPTQTTGFTVILNRVTDRAMLTHLGAINALTADQVPDDLMGQARHLHIASYFLQTRLQPDIPELFGRARVLGLTTSLDTNWDPSEQWSGVHDLLPLVDVFLPNENEACALTKMDSVIDSIRKLGTNSKIVAVKMGAEGGIAVEGATLVQAPVIPVELVDTVGAGDTFDAGFIYGFLAGWPLEKSLKLGVACGSLSTEKPGGLEGQPTLAEALGAIS